MDEHLAERPPAPEGPPEPAEVAIPQLRFLRGLVTALAAIMSAGIIAIVALLWLRLAPGAGTPPLPPGLALPEGTSAAAVTFAKDWTVVVTETGEILLYDRAGALKSRVTPGD